VTVSQPRQGLSESTVVAAALRVAERDGIDGLTMRALASELGVTQMAPYYYFASKDDLLSRLLDGILASLDVPEPGSGPWDQLLRKLMFTELRELAKYRGIGHVWATRNASPTFLATTRAYIDILTEGGFSTEDAFMAFDLIQSQLVGRLLLLDRLRERKDRRVNRLLGLSIPEKHFEDYATFTVDVIVNGLKLRQAFGTMS
jgi:TetR/AcrR family transcriptional regulator, tetracycline repressor protein